MEGRRRASYYATRHYTETIARSRPRSFAGSSKWIRIIYNIGLSYEIFRGLAL